MIFSPILADLVSAMLGWALFAVSLFLVLLILVQRGRGGGLTGALGGPGGQSAFGTKAGDLFTRITSFVALGWIALCAFTMWLIGSHAPSVAVDPTPVVAPSPADTRSSVNPMLDLGLEGLNSPGELTPAAPATPEVTSEDEFTDPAMTPATSAPAEPATPAPAEPATPAPAEPAPPAPAEPAASAETPNP
jgi:preprotein translocase subunit SecG